MIWILLIFILIVSGFIIYILRFCFLISKISLTVPFPAQVAEPSPHQEEKVEFQAVDGSLIEGRWIPALTESSKVILFCHELGADLNAWHKYGSYLPEMGFNVLSFNFRKLRARLDGTEQISTGQWVTTNDRDDVLAALKFLETSHYGASKEIGILGISKGANAALAALKHTSKVQVVVTDGAFSTTETVLDYVKKWVQIFVPNPWICRNTPDWFYRLMVRGSLSISSFQLHCGFIGIEKSLRQTSVPIFFIHGENDGYVSPRQAQYLFDITHSQEDIWIVPKARHNEAVEVMPEEYREKVVSFFNGNIK